MYIKRNWVNDEDIKYYTYIANNSKNYERKEGNFDLKHGNDGYTLYRI